MKINNKRSESASSGGELAGIFLRWAEKILALSGRIEGMKGKIPELLAMGLYSVLHFLVAMVHEPWFDEALAWMIAKDSSVYELLFEIPHYEGHPALWHLILMPFAKMGAPYELSLSIVTFVFAGGAVALLVFKSGFPRIVRLILPFTYFFFYQFGVVSRPYCMMMLAFFVMAICFRKRNEHPGRYTAALLFLCATSAYGIVVAGGLAVCWIVELWRKSADINEDCRAAVSRGKGEKAQKQQENLNSRFGRFINLLWKKKCVLWLALLLIYALSVIWRIIPAADTYAAAKNVENEATGIVERVLYMLFGSVADCFVTNTFSTGTVLNETGVSIMELCVSVLIGAGILILIVRRCRQVHLMLEFAVPYLLITVFSAFVYASRHHIGIIFLFMVFWMWIAKVKEQGEKTEAYSVSGTEMHKRNNGFSIDCVLPLIYLVCLIIPLYWSISTSVIEIFSSYSWGHSEAEFIKENGLEGYNMLAQWDSMPALANGKNGEKQKSVTENRSVDEIYNSDVDVETNGSSAITFSSSVTYLLPYLEEDNFLNSVHQLGTGFGMLHRIPSEDETAALIEKIKNSDSPDIVFGSVSFSAIYGPYGVNENDYVCVHSQKGGSIWKGVPEQMDSRIYVKKEIAEKMGLREVAR